METERRRPAEDWIPQNVERPSRTPYRRTRDSGETRPAARPDRTPQRRRFTTDAQDDH
jgi:hypothetical protein